MNRKTTLTVITLVFFSTWFNSARTYASFSKTPHGYSKSFVASSGTIWVPDNHTTIQEAINNANEGDTISVRAGTYYEHISIDKSLTLVGENRSTTVIDGNGTPIVVYAVANNITLSGFTIQNGVFGIWFSSSNNNILSDINASNNSHGIHLSWSSNNALTGNIASNNQYGIYLDCSGYNTLAGVTALDNQYGVYLYYSRDNILAGVTASNNRYGIYLEGSGYNTLTGNNFSSNNRYGIYLEGSGYNTLAGNNFSSNNRYGIYVDGSDGNVLSGNIASNNRFGIYLSYSRDNTLAGVTALDNQYGVYLYYSRDNILAGVTASNNQYGIRLISSSDNTISHNNFIKNTEPASSVDSVNSWDNGAEGNYWSDYDGDDANWDGIGDTSYPIHEDNQDNYPLMATFLQFTIVKKNQSYRIDAVSNSTISSLQYRYDPDNKINAVSFEVVDAEGKGFCRISIAHALIETPYTVTVDQNSPLYFETVYTNKTHTWLYFTYDPLEHEVTIVHTPYPEQLVLSRWAILGLAIIIIVLLSVNINYYRKLSRQKKVIEVYERELRSFPLGHSERAGLRFVKDVVERKEKIERFKKKYGINIQPAGTLEDLMEKLGVKEKKVNR